MARPKSTKKVPKLKGGVGKGKRKLGGGPSGGAPAGRPAKQSRREPRIKPEDRDAYEAEDSDPDEVKNAKRFDEVENYEYELPSDFEDEEIDEDLAFTEEDKKKFGKWFGKAPDADDDDGGMMGVGDDDGEEWGDDEEDEDEDGDEEDDGGDDSDDDGGRGARRRAPAAAADDDDDNDSFLDGDDDEDDDEDDDDEMEGDEEEDERHLAMLREVLGEADGPGGSRGGKRARRDPNAAVLSEAYPENEFGLNPGAASAGGAGSTLSIADLLAGLTGEERRKLGSARRLLEKVAGGGKDDDAEETPAGGKGGKAGKAGDKGAKAAGSKGLRPVAVPLPTVVAERQERRAGYEAAAEDVTKWTSIVKANREAPTLRLVSGREEVPRITTTAAIVAQHVPSADNALEAEVAALLEAAGAASNEAIGEAEEQLALKSLSLEEAAERRQRLAKLRSLLFYHELKSRRLKSIKSKEYHRHLARASKRKATKLAAAAADGAASLGGDVDAAAERAAAIEAEFQRAKERLTQRHRNSSRWARRALKRGQLEVDPGTKAALAEQLQLGQQLKRKIEGRRGSDDDASGDDASTSASDGEGDGGAGGLGGGGAAGGRTRSAALELLAGGGPVGEDAVKKGLLALPFMKRALERRRMEAQQEAEQLLRELDEQEAGAQGAGGVGEGDDDDAMGGGSGSNGAAGMLEALVGYGVPAAATSGTAGRRRFGGGAADGQQGDGGDAGVGDDDVDLDSDDVEDAEAKAERLGRQTREAAALTAVGRKQAAATAKKEAKKRKAAAEPTAEDQADLDATIAAGAAGRGLLVSSGGADVMVGSADAAEEERRHSGRAASSRSGGGGVLAEVAAQRGAVAGARAGLFQQKAAAAAGAAGGGGGDAAAVKFMASKKFSGARLGYVFKKGQQGVGYYMDTKSQPAAAAAGGKQQQQPGKGKSKGKGVDPAAVVVAVAVAGQAAKSQAAPAQGQQGQKGKAAGEQAEVVAAVAATAVSGGDGGGGGSDDEAAPLMQPAGAKSNRDLIQQAFAGDDVAAEFASEKAAAVAEEMPNIAEPSTLPGWGAWSGQQRNPKWMQAAKDRAAKQRADAAAGRKDAALKYVVVSEKWDKKAAKYTAPAAPFPFPSAEAYERSLRQPLGRQYNPDQAFRDLTRPAVLKQAGVMIEPLRFSESTAKELGKKGKKAEAAREGRRVVTVAGGMPRIGAGGGKK